MLKWWRDFRRFDKALNYAAGLFGCLIFTLAGLSLLIRSDDLANRLLGGFLLITGCGLVYWLWNKLRRLHGGGQKITTITCPSCQLEFRPEENEEESEDSSHCPRCGRIIVD